MMRTATVAPALKVVMVFEVVMSFLILLSPLPMRAQVPTEELPGEPTQQPLAAAYQHTVQPGETLSCIALDRLGAASEWWRIFDANRDQLADPDRIRPGMVLILPGAAAPTAAVEVARVQVLPQVDPADPTQDVPGYIARQELVRYRPFEPAAIPEIPVASRTVFYNVRSPDDLVIPVIIQPPQEITALPRAVFQAAGWLVRRDDPPEALGEVVDFAGDQDVRFGRDTVLPYDEVRVRLFEGALTGVVEGDELLVFGITRGVQDIGEVAAPSGRLRVTGVDPAGLVAQVVQEYDRIHLGQYVTHLRTFPLEVGVHPVDSDVRTEARILAFQDQKELYLPGDFAFIDLGRDQGLAVGDEMLGVEGDDEGWSDRSAARFQVVGLRDDVATVRILSTRSPGVVRPGLRMILDRTMP